jgi:hypothetical protein
MKTTTMIVYLTLATVALASFARSRQARADCREGCDLVHANTFLGDDALYFNTTGSANTATGDLALYINTAGSVNTATGWQALAGNTSGDANTASGARALYTNTTGSSNTATGVEALSNNTTGIYNAAHGSGALFNNTIGSYNIGNGSSALYYNTTGNNNTATGFDALELNTNGSSNTATGVDALQSNSTGNNNIALGNAAGANLTTGDSNIDIGNQGVAAEANTIRIGTEGTETKTFIAGINGTAVMGGPVKVNANGQLGTTPSSQRFKTQIKPMDKASEAILALKPVTFRYKKEIDPEGVLQFGLVAEDVEKLNPDLVMRDREGKPYTVRYEAVNAMLLNEFLKEHQKVEEQQATIGQLKSNAAKQEATISELNKEMEVLTS